MKKKIKPAHGIELNESSKKAILKTFGAKLKKLRDKKDFSQEAVAYASGMSRSYYADIEDGRRNLSLINIAKVLITLNAGFDELMPLSELKKFIK
jgi:transcriptional regulator with XRE-family HTH domain